MNQETNGINKLLSPAARSRQAIWAIHPKWTTTYFALFIVQCIVGMWIIVWDETLVVPHVRWTDVYTDIIQGIGEVGISSAVIAFVLTEVLNSIMLVSEWIRRNLVEATKERQFAEGRAEGRAQLIEEISDWEERRREAQERGEAFDESPPYLKN